MIKSFKKFLVYHPLSLEKTGLIVKLLPSLIVEKQDVMKWIRKINAKDIRIEFSQPLLFDYFILHEIGYKKELDLLLKKTNKCFFDNNEFTKMKKCIFDSIPKSEENIEELKGNFSKGIYLYYLFCNEYSRGNTTAGNPYADKAIELIPAKIMIYIVNRKKSEYEKEN